MSIIKTKCPNLEELATAIGSIDGTDSNKLTRPLCENIFDVQRSELFDVLERLRRAFWSDEKVDTVPPEPLIPHVQVELPPPTSKRVRSEPDEDITYQQQPPSTPTKRVRLEHTPEPIPPIPTPVPAITTTTTTQVTYYSSLWPFKKLLIQRIKNTTQKDAETLTFINQIYQSQSKEQCRHMSLYLLPVAKAMRKQHIIDALNKWI